MERSETRQLVASAREAHATGHRVALATVVGVHGSAYRREGASMLVRDDGAQTCMLSGGCLEPEVVEAALEALREGRSRVTRYDLSEDVVWGLGIGCGGSVDILIEPLTGDALLEAWLDVLGGARAAVLVTPLAGAGGRLLVPAEGDVQGALWRGDHVAEALMDEAVRHARRLLAQPEAPCGPHAFTSPELGHVPAEVAELFFAVNVPPPELVLFGAGHDAVPLAAQAVALGYDVRVVDVREGFLTSGRFPGATLDLCSPDEFAARLRLGPRSHAVIMNHHLERDRLTLRFALEAGVPYVGVLGPRSRYERLLAGLADEGFRPTPAQLARVRSPVGLRVGAETPEEVALSIVTELMALRRGQGGGFLSGHDGRIHERQSAPPRPPEQRPPEQPPTPI